MANTTGKDRCPTPIVMLTAAKSADELRLLKSGVPEYLDKRFAVEEFRGIRGRPQERRLCPDATFVSHALAPAVDLDCRISW